MTRTELLSTATAILAARASVLPAHETVKASLIAASVADALALGALVDAAGLDDGILLYGHLAPSGEMGDRDRLRAADQQLAKVNGSADETKARRKAKGKAGDAGDGSHLAEPATGDAAG